MPIKTGGTQGEGLTDRRRPPPLPIVGLGTGYAHSVLSEEGDTRKLKSCSGTI